MQNIVDALVEEVRNAVRNDPVLGSMTVGNKEFKHAIQTYHSSIKEKLKIKKHSPQRLKAKLRSRRIMVFLMCD